MFPSVDRLDAERKALDTQHKELEIAERVLARFGGKRLQPRSEREQARPRLRRWPLRMAERAVDNRCLSCR